MLLREGQRKAWFLVPLLALVVTACEITVSPLPPPEFPPVLHGTVTAQSSLTAPSVFSGTLAAGETRYYRVAVNTANDLLLVDVDGSNLRVALHTGSGSVRAVSNTPTYFAGSVSDLSLSAIDEAQPAFIAPGRAVVDGAAPAVEADLLEPQSLSVNIQCFGPCVATPIGSTSSYYVSVRNLSTGNRGFDLYAFNYNALDLNEPNASAGQATPIGAAGDAGAIEWLGDQDWFRYTGITQFITFHVYDPDLGLRLVIPEEAPNPDTVLDGIGVHTTTIFNGDVFYVHSSLGRAGPTDSSRYNITFSPVAP